MSRREFPRKVRQAAIERAAGHCERCKAVLKHGEAEIDHILPDVLGGEPVLANAMVLCKVCHKEKTADDIRRTRKADRQRDRFTGAMLPPRIKIKSAGFLKRRERTPKPSLPPVTLYRRGEFLPVGKNREE